MKAHFAVALVALLGTAVAFAHSKSKSPTTIVPEAVPARSVPPAFNENNWEMSSSSATLRQYMAFGARYNGDPRTFAVLNYTTPYAIYPDECYEWSASFDIELAAARKKDRFYVKGRTSSGEETIERWNMKQKIGQPGGGGSGYVMKRTEIYRGLALNGVRAMAVDPDLQFLLVHHDTPPKLSKVAIPSGTITTLYTTTEVSSLDSDAHSLLYVRDHLAEGRIWTLETTTGTAVPNGAIMFFTNFYDLDKDGTIESWTPFVPEDFLDLYWSGGGGWENLFEDN